MKVEVTIGQVTVTVDDGNSSEPCSARWQDQFQRIKETVELATGQAIKGHAQLMGDPE